MHETQPRPLIMDAEDYNRLATELDEPRLHEAFIGIWPSRSALGVHMLEEQNAGARLDGLPLWLKPYVSLDGEKYVREIEEVGGIRVGEIKQGICVFDGLELARLAR